MSAKTNRLKKQSFIQGALILSLGTIVVKLISALFKLPLTNLITEEGMGYFKTAYDLFNPISVIAIAGLPVAISKMVSENIAKKRYANVKKIKKIATITFLTTGIIGFLMMFLGGQIFADLASNPHSYLAMWTLSPAIFFLCMMSLYRGYYQGLHNMLPTAISQITEALAKVIFGLGFAYITMKLAQEQIDSGSLTIFGIMPTPEFTQRNIVLALAAAAAVLGVTCSTVIGFIYLYFKFKITGDGIRKLQIQESEKAQSGKVLLKKLLKISIPVCLGALVVNLTSMIDVFSIMNRLGFALETAQDTVINMYSGLSAEVESGKLLLNDIPNFLYGSYGMAVNLFLLVPTITTSFGVSALPSVSAAWALKDKRKIKTNIEAVIRMTSLIAIPAGLGLSVLSGPILELIYYKTPIGAGIAESILQVLGVAVIFVSLSGPINSVLQAIGKTSAPVIIMTCGGILKLVINYMLVGNAQFNIKAAPIGTLVCYIFIAVVSVVVLIKETNIVPDIVGTFVKPLIAGLFCAGSAWLINSLLSGYSRVISVGVSIVVAMVVYGIILLLLGGIKKNDILLLPFGKKIAKVLEKMKLIV